MKMSSAFPGKYIKAGDLAGKPKVITITGVAMESVGDDSKPVIRFKDSEQGWVLNLTNSNIITDMLGSDDSTKWVGKKVEMYPDKTQFGSKIVDCIRVRAPSNGAQF